MNVSQLHSGESNGVMFSSSFGNKEFKLIEVCTVTFFVLFVQVSNNKVPEDVFKLILCGESLKIVGGNGEEALLSSKDHTYTIKRVESSNSGRLSYTYTCGCIIILLQCILFLQRLVIVSQLNRCAAIIMRSDLNYMKNVYLSKFVILCVLVETHACEV